MSIDHDNTTTTSPSYVHCGFCGNYHQGRCPEIRSIEYFPNGMIKRIEFVDGRIIAKDQSHE